MKTRWLIKKNCTGKYQNNNGNYTFTYKYEKVLQIKNDSNEWEDVKYFYEDGTEESVLDDGFFTEEFEE